MAALCASMAGFSAMPLSGDPLNGPQSRGPSSCSFSIDSILGLDRKDPAPALRPHRPWLDSCASIAEFRSCCLHVPHVPLEARSSSDGGPSEPEEEDGVSYREQCQLPERAGYRRDLSWYRGRRPRTAFTRAQIEALESIFRLNSYPGIDIREELAEQLDLDEDRIQIWFQNRRAKLKRTHRESRFLMVKSTFSRDLQD